jgi:flagellar M-ring protein FliF
MNEWFKKVGEKLKTAWGKWTTVQKVVAGAIVLAVLIAIGLLVGVSSAPTATPVFNVAITDENLRDRIVARINQENVQANVTPAGLVTVKDDKTARAMRSILLTDGLYPANINPWDAFDQPKWTTTDFERNVNFQRSIQAMLTEHIKSLAGVENAVVDIAFAKKELFQQDQKPTTASVIITPSPGSDITTNRKKIEGIQKLLTFAVVGLTPDNVTITDNTGLVLNDFENMKDFDKAELTQKQQKITENLESKYERDILSALQSTFGADRVRDLNVKIDMDWSSKKVEKSEITPIIQKPRTPGLPYDDSITKISDPVSQTSSKTSWKGTGFNPEGPAGVEGQTAPAVKDMSNLYGEVSQTTETTNYLHNTQKTEEVASPSIKKVSISVNIDGTWKEVYNDKGKLEHQPNGMVKREYTALTATELGAAQKLIEGAIGYDATRGDTVNITNIQFDRTQQFQNEWDREKRNNQILWAIVVGIAGIALLIVAFLIIQSLARARERQRQKREAELARQAALERESAILEAEKAGQEVGLSVEEQQQAEAVEKAIQLAKEHPADVSQLIRTWLMEE